MAENVEHLDELKACVNALGLENSVEFRRNIGDGTIGPFHNIPTLCDRSLQVFLYNNEHPS